MFHFMLQMGAGTGLLFLLRWFWWRINAFSELTAMVVSFCVAVGLEFFGPESLPSWAKITLGVGITTLAWVLATFLTKPTDLTTLVRFYKLVRPGGPGWAPVLRQAASEGQLLEQSAQDWNVPSEILCMLIGCTAVYSALIATGYWIYSNWLPAALLTILAGISTVLLFVVWKRVHPDYLRGEELTQG